MAAYLTADHTESQLQAVQDWSKVVYQENSADP